MGELLWRKDGTSFPAEHWAHPLQTTSSPTVAVFTVWDITKGQHTQEVLVQSWRPFLDTRSRKICSGGAYMWMERIQPEDFGRVDQAFHALFENQKLFPRIRVNLVRFKRVACDLRHHSYSNDGTKFGSRSFRVLLRVRARQSFVVAEASQLVEPPNSEALQKFCRSTYRIGSAHNVCFRPNHRSFGDLLQ
jgi:hypothetical protein